MRTASPASWTPVPSGAGRTRMVRVSIRPLVISLVAAAAGVVSQGSALSCAFRFGWLPRTGNRKCAFFSFRSQSALSRVVCIASAVMRTSSRGSGPSSGVKWVTSLAWPSLATLSWAMTRPGTWVTAASRCTFFFPPALASLRSFPSTATAGTRGDVVRGAGYRRVQPGMIRVRPEPAVSPFLPEAFRGRGLPLPLLPPFLPRLLFFLLVRGKGGRDAGVERGGGQARGQRGLELVGIQQPGEPAQRRSRRRDAQPGPGADAAAVRGQHVLVPARRGLRDRQRPVVPRRHPRDQHRYQRRQQVPLPLRPPLIGQPARQRLPEGLRVRSLPGRKVAADTADEP